VAASFLGGAQGVVAASSSARACSSLSGGMARSRWRGPLAAARPGAGEREERVGGNETGERESRVWDMDLGFQD
jgi:hypothetical protein